MKKWTKLENYIYKGLSRYYNFLSFNYDIKHKDLVFYKMCDNLNILIIKTKENNLKIYFNEYSNLIVRTANNKLRELKDSLKNFNSSFQINTVNNADFNLIKNLLNTIGTDYILINGNSWKRYLCQLK